LGPDAVMTNDERGLVRKTNVVELTLSKPVNPRLTGNWTGMILTKNPNAEEEEEEEEEVTSLLPLPLQAYSENNLSKS